MFPIFLGGFVSGVLMTFISVLFLSREAQEKIERPGKTLRTLRGFVSLQFESLKETHADPAVASSAALKVAAENVLKDKELRGGALPDPVRAHLTYNIVFTALPDEKRT